MNRTFTALLAGHTLVASMAWATGYIAGRLSERRCHELLDWRQPVSVCDIIDLVGPPGPYDWARDGEALEATR